MPNANCQIKNLHWLRVTPDSAALKLSARISDFPRMARDLSCPVCNADLLLSGDEQLGEEIYCTYCGAPCRIKQGASPDAVDVEEDF